MDKSDFLWWFKFCPSKFVSYLTATDQEAGKRFKVLLTSLMTNTPPENIDSSPEEEMILEAQVYRNKQRERAMARWKPTEKNDSPTPPPPQRTSRHTKPKTIELRDIYDWCDANNVPPPVGKEFFDYNESTGWNITTTWQNALKGFAKSKLKNRSK